MEIVFRTKYRTFVKVQYGKWNVNEQKFVTVYKSIEDNSNKVVNQEEVGCNVSKTNIR